MRRIAPLLAAAFATLTSPSVAQQAIPLDMPLLQGAQAAPACGDLLGLAGHALCVTTPLERMESLTDAYIAHLGAQGWLIAGGDGDRAVFVRRKTDGGCDGLQMLAFYDTSRPATADTPGYLGFSSVPGACGAPEAAQ